MNGKNPNCPFGRICMYTPCAFQGEEHNCSEFKDCCQDSIVMLPVRLLHPHPENPRKDLGDLEELAESIKAKGVLQNLTVTPRLVNGEISGKEWMQGYTVVMGHRRLAGAKQAGLTEVPCRIVPMSHREQLENMLLENMARSDLTRLEEAEGFQLLLDLGDSVEDVAQKTGFSESTVRRRVKLLELDRESLKKAELRGGTMADYEKLGKIEDPEKRNKVLGMIGTAEFAGALRGAINAQENRKYLDGVEAELRSADWCREVTEQEMRSGDYAYVDCYGIYNKRQPAAPKDAGDREYVFWRSGNNVYIYGERIKEKDKPLTAREKLRQEYQRRMSELVQELELMNQEHRDLREEFIERFDAFNTYADEILAFCVRAILEGDCPDREDLAGLLNIQFDDDDGLDPEALDRQLRNRPAEVALYTAYCCFEDGQNGFWRRKWDSSLQASVPVADEDELKVTLYKCLRSLGYEMNLEEQKALAGDLPQLRAAKALLEEYEQEGKRLDQGEN